MAGDERAVHWCSSCPLLRGLDRQLDTAFSLQLLTGGQVRTREGWIKESRGLGVGMILQCDFGKQLPKIRALTIVVWTG